MLSKKIMPVVLLVVVILAFSCSQKPQELTVTYISNSGFLLSAPEGNVLIDALFNQGFGYYLVPDEQTRVQITNGEAPFQKIDLYLVTHDHGDHFFTPWVAEFLKKHPETRLVSSPQVCDSLLVDSLINKQISNAPLSLGQVIDTVFQNIPVKIYRTRHLGDDSGEQCQNYAFLLTLNGMQVMFLGDGPMDYNYDLYEKFNLGQENIDILFVEYFGHTREKVQYIQDVVKPKHIIALHIPQKEFETELATMQAAYPNVIVFNKLLEKRIFSQNGIIQ
ncbi:MAG TPA: MBL fold metallo-hydrolase [bacterium]|nr:MBL fold metallo-hydrolase [bacterium]HPN45856.1 MBL fold metallo-hydrolase [bacterium]